METANGNLLTHVALVYTVCAPRLVELEIKLGLIAVSLQYSLRSVSMLFNSAEAAFARDLWVIYITLTKSD